MRILCTLLALAPSASALSAGVAHPSIGTTAFVASRRVSCSESVTGTRFPYVGSNDPGARYRLILGTVAVPPAYHKQVVHNRTESWPYFVKAGLVIRANAKTVVVAVPAGWRNRAGIAWGLGGGGVSSSVRFTGCNALPARGLAYPGGFYLRHRGACLPLTFRVGHRSATVRFGLGRRCP